MHRDSQRQRYTDSVANAHPYVDLLPVEPSQRAPERFEGTRIHTWRGTLTQQALADRVLTTTELYTRVSTNLLKQVYAGTHLAAS